MNDFKLLLQDMELLEFFHLKNGNGRMVRLDDLDLGHFQPYDSMIRCSIKSKGLEDLFFFFS